MTREEIIAMAREAGLENYGPTPSAPYSYGIFVDCVERFVALVAKHEREACAKPRDSCNPHPKAPHGFSRNASHAEDRYVCECESWDPWDAGYQQGMIDTLLEDKP